MKAKFSIKQWFSDLSTFWKTVTILGGMVTVTITATLTIEHFRVKVVNANSVIEYLQKDVIKRDKRERIKDSIETARHNEINKNFTDLYDRLKRDSTARALLQDNYSSLIWNKFGSEWRKYMNGMSIVVVQDPAPPTVSKSYDQPKPTFKMKIVPINKKDTTKIKK